MRLVQGFIVLKGWMLFLCVCFNFQTFSAKNNVNISGCESSGCYLLLSMDIIN